MAREYSAQNEVLIGVKLQPCSISKKSRQSKMSFLTEEQIELAAKYFTVSNTGLIGCGHEPPTTKGEIENLYNTISGDYAQELGEGLESELNMWKHTMKQVDSDESSWYKTIQKDIPFILEVV